MSKRPTIHRELPPWSRSDYRVVLHIRDGKLVVPRTFWTNAVSPEVAVESAKRLARLHRPADPGKAPRELVQVEVKRRDEVMTL